MTELFIIVSVLYLIVFIHMLRKIIKYEKAIDVYIKTDVNKVYQENKQLRRDNEDLSEALDRIQNILDDFEINDEN